MQTFTKSLEIYQQNNGHSSPGCATIYHTMGNINFSSGKYLDALEFYKKAIYVHELNNKLKTV